MTNIIDPSQERPLTLQQRNNNSTAATVIEELEKAFNANKQANGKAFISGLPLDHFLAISDYSSNRKGKERAEKAGKKAESHLKGALVVPQQTEVKIIFITRQACPSTWARVAAECMAKGVPCTLPFVIQDGHTRKNAWQLKDKEGFQLENPETVDALIYSLNVKGEPITDDDFFKMVEAECSKDTAATALEVNDMALKECGLDKLKSNFCSKSWANPAAIFAGRGNKIPPKEIRKEFSDGFLELDKLGLPYIAPAKFEEGEITPELKARFCGGVKAAILFSFRQGLSSGLTIEEVVKGFWLDFYRPWVKDAEPKELEDGPVRRLIDWMEDPERRSLSTSSVVDIHKTSTFNAAVFLQANSEFKTWCEQQAQAKTNAA